MYNDLEERTKEHFTNPMVICATFLDPRYRKFHFIKDEKERENFINKAKNYIISTYLTKFKSKIIQSDEPMPPLPKKKRISRENNFSLLCEEDENDDDKIVNGVVSEKAEIELEINNYFLMKIKVNKHSNPLEFYKNNQSLFKRLSKISNIVFSITSSSTASEEKCSNAGDIITDTRNQLLPEHSEDLVMVSQNKGWEYSSKFAFFTVFYFFKICSFV